MFLRILLLIFPLLLSAMQPSDLKDARETTQPFILSYGSNKSLYLLEKIANNAHPRPRLGSPIIEKKLINKIGKKTRAIKKARNLGVERWAQYQANPCVRTKTALIALLAQQKRILLNRFSSQIAVMTNAYLSIADQEQKLLEEECAQLSETESLPASSDEDSF